MLGVFLVMLTSAGALTPGAVAPQQPHVYVAPAADQAEVGEERPAPLPIIAYEGGLLSVTLQRSSLQSVLDEVTRQTQVHFALDPALKNQVVSARFEDLSLDDGVRRILENQDVLYFYGVREDTSVAKPEETVDESAENVSERLISEQPSSLIAVWVYPKGRGHGFQPMPLERWATRMSQNREAVLGAEQPLGSSADAALQIHVKFRPGNQTDHPELSLPADLRKSVATMDRLFTLPQRELDGLGAGRLNLWFKITLIPGTDPDDFVQRLNHLKSVDTAERAPVPCMDPTPLP